ncbi:MAG: CDP-alcohol phosphatidyltransferase family protein [Bacteroidia bacterium]|nr:CDP-alcohol phosphatidyltransferase family protein [Bacteroidia bacterium]
MHIFTSLGLITGFLALIATGEKNWQEAYFWLFVCFIIDGVDGSLARKFRVKKVLPYMDGKSIDFVIDFATYAIIPAYFFYQAEMVSEAWMYPCLTIILIVSAIYYGKEGMVADNQYFVGFPVLWNLVIFYAFFVFHNQPRLTVAMVFFFGVLHFIPIKFAYPSRSRRYFFLHLLVSVVWFIAGGYILYKFPDRSPLWEGIALGAGVYFGIIALLDTWGTKNPSVPEALTGQQRK